jgi:hypothetical protein
MSFSARSAQAITTALASESAFRELVTELAAAGGGGGGGGTTSPVAHFVVGPGADIAVANNVAGWVPLVGSGVLHGAFVNSKAGSGPTGAALILDVKLSTNGGSTWTSLWHATPASRPTIADGAVIGSAGAPDTTSYANGNLVRLDVIQVGATTPGRDVVLLLY